jgi:hypothetical protein
MPCGCASPHDGLSQSDLGPNPPLATADLRGFALEQNGDFLGRQLEKRAVVARRIIRTRRHGDRGNDRRSPILAAPPFLERAEPVRARCARRRLTLAGPPSITAATAIFLLPPIVKKADANAPVLFYRFHLRRPVPVAAVPPARSDYVLNCGQYSAKVAL